jgi:hypothetical protein
MFSLGLVAAHVILDDTLWSDIANMVRNGPRMLGVFYAREHAREKKVTTTESGRTGFHWFVQLESVTSLADIHQVGIAARVVRLIPGVGGHGHVVYAGICDFISCDPCR